MVAQRRRVRQDLLQIEFRRAVEAAAAARSAPVGQVPRVLRRGLVAGLLRSVAGPDIVVIGVQRRVGVRFQGLAVGQPVGSDQIAARILGRRVRARRVLGRRHARIGVVHFKKRVPLDLAFDIFGELGVGKLQQLDRLLQLRRHYQRLRLSEIEALGKRHG